MDNDGQRKFCVRHGFIDVDEPLESNRAQSFPPLSKNRIDFHMDNRSCPSSPELEDPNPKVQSNRPSSSERSLYKHRPVIFQQFEQMDDPVFSWILKLLVQKMNVRLSLYVHDITKVVESFPSANMKFLIRYDEAKASENIETVEHSQEYIGFFLAADLQTHGLILIDWWVVPEFCKPDVFEAIGKWIILDLFSERKPLENNLFVRYKKILICHPVANGAFQDMEMQVLEKFGMQSACQPVKNVLYEDAKQRAHAEFMIDYVRGHHWWQWRPYSKQDFCDKRAALVRRNREVSRSRSPVRSTLPVRQTIDACWWEYSLEHWTQLQQSHRCVPSWHSEVGASISTLQIGTYLVRECMFGVLITTVKSNSLSLQWDVDPGLHLHVVYYPRSAFLESCKEGHVEIIGNLKTEVYIQGGSDRSANILMKEVHLDQRMCRSTIGFESLGDEFEANIQLKPCSKDNKHILDTLYSNHPLRCDAQVICNVHGSTCAFPPQAIILDLAILLSKDVD